MKKSSTYRFPLLATAAVLALTVTGCTAAATGEETNPTTAEAASKAAPLAVSYANGIAVLDGTDLSIRSELSAEEFTRLNAAGDGRNVMVTTSQGFQVLDTEQGQLRPITFSATTPGHVVRHAGNTVLFDDGTGDTTIFESSALATSGDELPATQVIKGEAAHHGVSVKLEDGTLLTTVGTSESRSGAKALDTDGKQLAISDECPGVHGEGTAAHESVVFGCEDGILLFHDGHFEKFTAPDEYGRMGNAYVSENSSWVVGDYKNDPDDEGYLLKAVTLLDTEAHKYQVMQLPAGVEYTWRGVVRGPGENAYILGTDGSIHVLDPATGKLTDSYPVIEAWEGPKDWQEPHPAMTVNGSTAYIADPATKRVLAVDLETGKQTASVELKTEPNEMAVALG